MLSATAAGATGVPSFQWLQTAFGDAGTATYVPTDGAGQSLQVTFSADASGAFTFSVTATDVASGGTGTTTHSVTVTPSGTSEQTTYTLGADDLSGTANDDTFSALPGLAGGVQAPTFQTGDMADGGDGTDTVNITFPVAANVVPGAHTALEVFNVSAFGGASTITASNITGATTFNSVDSTVNLTINSLGSVVDFGMIRSGATSLLPTMLAPATAAGDDTVALALQGVTAGSVFNLTTAANGIEVLGISSSGGAANTLTTLTQTTGTTLATVNVSGDTALTIGALDNQNTVTTLNASGMTAGGLTATVGTTILTFTGSPADDVLDIAGSYTTADTLDGGDGTDMLRLTQAETNVGATVQANVSNFEGLTISDAMAQTLTVTRFGSAVNRVDLEVGMNGGSLTFAAGSASVNQGLRTSNAATGTGTGAFVMSGPGITDSLTYTLNDAETGNNAQTFTGIETVNLVSNVDLDGTAAATGTAGQNVFSGTAALTVTPTAGTGTLNISGTEDLNLGSGIVTVGTINAGSFTEALLMTLNTTGSVANSTTATTITGGSGNDVLVGSAAADTMTSGTGNNTMQPGRGVDFCTFSAGSNILDLEDLAVAQALVANRVTAVGLTFDGTDYTAVNEVDALRFDNITTQGDLSDGAVAGEFQVVTTPAAAYTMVAGQAVLELAFEFSAAVDLASDLTNGATLLSAAGALTGTTPATIATSANDEDIVIIAYQGGNAYIYHGNGAGGNTALVAAEINLVAVISGGATVGGIQPSNLIN
ncbi:MAG: hypothetical protein JXA69_13570 [Phycisphaerae bacterium]|nr:hypothetical protein [Phycisphaerae bacterium]